MQSHRADRKTGVSPRSSTPGTIAPADALLIVPPFGFVDRPSLAAHILQACAREAGFEVRVLYANLGLAAAVGLNTYGAICRNESNYVLLGERLFSRLAFERHRPRGNGNDPVTPLDDLWEDDRFVMGPEEFDRAEDTAARWAHETAQAVARSGIPVVGATTSYYQTCAAIALLGLIKEMRDETMTIIGGANCEAEMALGIASIAPSIDYVFSGESEASFPELLARRSNGDLWIDRIIRCEPCADLDRIPTPDYGEYFDQLGRVLPESPANEAWLTYESSRGCWWGERRRCTFCGLNGVRIGFRQKSPGRVLDDLQRLERTHPGRRVAMADNVMPKSFFEALVPELCRRESKQRIFYEIRTGLSLEQVVALKTAGITMIQAGIEAVSPGLLRRFEKGIAAAHAIALLRYARAVKIAVYWNLLYEVPGDRIEEYEETLEVLRLLRHLAPPTQLTPVDLRRFSRYAEHPEEFGISNLRPYHEYGDVFPADADLESLVFNFEGDFHSAAREHPEIIERIADELDTHRSLWTEGSGPPLLHVSPHSGGLYVIVDSRGVCDGPRTRLIDRDQALAALAAGPGVPAAAVDWAIEHRVGIRLGGSYVPLATADPGVIADFESRVIKPTT
jgi:ribosomal peptide maturation radical SAM protein 1